jgi:hypothetical protein
VPRTPGKSFDVTADLLPPAPTKITSDGLVILKSKYRYGGYYQVDLLWFYAEPEEYRLLALLLLSRLFHPHSKPTELSMTHLDSEIKTLMLDYNYETNGRDGLHIRPYKLSYTAGSLDYQKQPFYAIPLLDRVSFRLTNRRDEVNWDEYDSRDGVWLGGNERAYAWLAWELLNFGRERLKQNEFSLTGSGEEGSALGGWSAEARFIHPGYAHWRERERQDEED